MKIKTKIFFFLEEKEIKAKLANYSLIHKFKRTRSRLTSNKCSSLMK